MKTDLKKLAEELVHEINARDLTVALYRDATEARDLIVTLLERVQKETLQARIVWPNIIEYTPRGNPHEIARGVADWLRDNIRIAPTQNDDDYLNDWPHLTEKKDEK